MRGGDWEKAGRYRSPVPGKIEVGMAKKPASTAQPKPVQIRLDEPEPDTLRIIGGSRSDKFNNALIRSMVSSGWFPSGQSDEDRNQQIFVAVTALQAFKPTDEIEAMLAAQAMAAHHAAMECSRRAMVPDQPFEAAQGFRKAAANASRTFIELLSALDRKRGKGGQQVVRVEHVHVHRGGQAIVGNVRGGDTAVAKPAAPLAIGQEQSGLTLDDLIGQQPERVGEGGV
jgi:predicted component of type VI protein secretion system